MGAASITDSYASLVSRAERELAAGRFADAERDIRGALALDPGDPRALKVHAALMQRRGLAREAAAVLRRAEARAPDDPLLLNSLAIALQTSGDGDAAIHALRRAAALAPANAAIRANLGKMLVDAGELHAGIALLRSALERMPELTHARFTLAYAERARGNFAEAEAGLREILRREPRDGNAWLALADLGVRASDDDIACMEAALADSGVGGRPRIALRFALARALEAAARCDEAWPHYVQANGEVRRIEPWDAAAERGSCERLLCAFDAATTSAPHELGREIVFIVGLPRSGTTLAEQILVSHPNVAAGGEIGALSRVLDAECRRRGEAIEAWALRATAEDWERLGREYLDRTASLRVARPRSTDKRPGNWRYMGAIRRMLPGARIVICRRDPVETALGCFVRLFSPGTQGFSYDLGDLASYWRSFDGAARRALARDRAALHELHVEALIDDPEREIRALLAGCGLDFDPACLAFGETERAVHTQSAVQVRGGLRAGPQRVAWYGKYIDALRRALSVSER